MYFPPPPPNSRRPARRSAFACCCILLWVLGAPVSAAGPMLAIVAPKSADFHYSKDDLANIFRRRLRFSTAGETLVPVNLPLANPIRIAFSRSVYDLFPEDMEAYWNERYFHGVSPPHVVASVEAMLRFVAGTPNAIGYVLDCQVDDRVEVILRIAIADPDPGLTALCSDRAAPQ